MKRLGVEDGGYEDCIPHFNGRKKPWEVYSGVVDEEYWQYFKKTPWGSDDEIFSEFYCSMKNNGATIIDRIMCFRTNFIFRMIHSSIKRILRKL